MKTKKLNVELVTFVGENICEAIEHTEYPAVIVLNGDRAFYKVGSRDKGKLGIYHECDTIALT